MAFLWAGSQTASEKKKVVQLYLAAKIIV